MTSTTTLSKKLTVQFWSFSGGSGFDVMIKLPNECFTSLEKKREFLTKIYDAVPGLFYNKSWDGHIDGLSILVSKCNESASCAKILKFLDSVNLYLRWFSDGYTATLQTVNKHSDSLAARSTMRVTDEKFSVEIRFLSHDQLIRNGFLPWVRSNRTKKFATREEATNALIAAGWSNQAPCVQKGKTVEIEKQPAATFHHQEAMVKYTTTRQDFGSEAEMYCAV